MRLKGIMLRGEKMEWNKPVLLNYENLEAIVKKPRNKNGFTKVLKLRNGKLYIKPFRKSSFKNNKELYVVAFTRKYLQDYKGKTQEWYKKQFNDFMADEYNKLNKVLAITISGWYNKKENSYNVDLGVITNNLETACYLINKYKQQAGWDLLKKRELLCN